MSARPEVLAVVPLIDSVMQALDHTYAVHRLYEAGDRDALLRSVGARIRGLATSGNVGADAALMQALPALEVVACYGVGVDAIDLAHAAGRGIVVTNTPDVLNDDVANLGVALLLAISRGLVAGDRFVRAGRWPGGNMPLMHGLRGKRVGILGLGRIGRDIARKLDAFGCEIVYHGRRAQPGQAYRYCPDLREMAADCAFLVVACPATAQTRGLVDGAILDALGPRGALINIARGSIVDEAALVAALTEGRLGYAALDVFADEPRVPEALWAMDNVILQPHVGSATVETRRAMGDLVVENLARHFAGAAVATPVSAATVTT